MDFIGQNELKRKATSAFEKGAGIVIGPRNYGKTFFAQWMASFYNLEYILVKSDVENAKALISDIEKGKLYHLKDFHKARPQVVSRLLKLLEDNIPKGAVILITTESTKTIETILSRCAVLKMNKYSLPELKEYKEVDEFLYRIYDTPTKLDDIHEQIDKLVDLVDDFIDNASTAKVRELTEFDYKLVGNILIGKLAEQGCYKVIQRLQRLINSFDRNDYIPNWQAVNLMMEDIRYDII